MEQLELNRDEQAEKLVDFLHKIKVEEVFDTEKHKIDFIKSLSFEDFKGWLERINGILRDVPIVDRDMDGKNMIIASALIGTDATFPRFEDKEDLLQKTFETIQKTDDVQDIALLLSSAIVAIHPFVDGNGRTSRFVYTLLNDNYDGTSEQTERLKILLGEDGRSKLNTSTVLLDHFVGLELCKEVGLNIEDMSKPTSLFPYWGKIRGLSVNLLKEDFNILIKLNDGDVLNFFISVYKYLKQKGVLDKYTKPIYKDNKLIRTVIDSTVLVPDLTSDDMEGIVETYWGLRKEEVGKMIDVFANPEQHLVPDSEKREGEKGKTITLKERFRERVLSTMER